MRDSTETKTSSFKGKKALKAIIDFDTPVHAARRRVESRVRQLTPTASATTPDTNPVQNFN